jgi:hypothetical protein
MKKRKIRNERKEVTERRDEETGEEVTENENIGSVILVQRNWE